MANMIKVNNTPVEVVKEEPFELFPKKVKDLSSSQAYDDPFFICDIGNIVEKYKTWRQQLPRVAPFYAVKANDEEGILSTLAELGTGFDCASKGEIEKVLGLGVAPERIIYAQACKQSSHLQYAAKNNVQFMTFDNEAELHKIKRLYPNAKLFLRITPPVIHKSKYLLRKKFGAQPDKVTKLFTIAKDLELNVIGASFHVGSPCYDVTAYTAAIASAKSVYDIGRDFGYKLSFLDLGGGFPGIKSSKPSFEEFSEELNHALDLHFPKNLGVSVIAEPGRYFVDSACALALNIIAKRVPDGITGDMHDSASDPEDIMYYVSDGLFGSFHRLQYNDLDFVPCVLDSQQYEGQSTYKSSVWGPTCCGHDILSSTVELPLLDIGDWLVSRDMGAYTSTIHSRLNAMPVPKYYYAIQESNWQELLSIKKRNEVFTLIDGRKDE